jgi:hypothetical protein
MNTQQSMENEIERAVQTTEEAAELMGKSLYRLLKKNGYDKNQVINVAGFILDGLIHDSGETNEGSN